MKRVKGNGISKELPSMYPDEYLWRERNSRDKRTAFINILEKLTFTGPYLNNTPKANEIKNV